MIASYRLSVGFIGVLTASLAPGPIGVGTQLKYERIISSSTPSTPGQPGRSGRALRNPTYGTD